MADAIETVDMASEEFAKYVMLKKVVVQDADGLPDPSQADAKTLYLVPKQKTGVDEGSWWDLYVVIGGSWANLSAVDKAGLVRLVNGKTPGATGAVVLKASDIAYDEQGGAPEGSVGAKIAAVSATATSAASTAAAKYSKPSSGIPSTDMASGVQTSLGKADSAVQPGDILDGGFIKASVLPSFVDDVLEYASADAFPQTGETGKIYVAKDTNKAYRWSGTQYVEISKSVDVVDPDSATVTGKAADALKVKQALAGKATKADATLTGRGFSEWTITAVPDGLDPSTVDVVWGNPMPDFYEHDAWFFGFYSGWEWTDNTDRNATSLSSGGFAATRTALPGYQLGSDTNHILASEAEAEALRMGKQDVLTFDNTPTAGSNDPVKSGGIWSAIWGALAALPAGFLSLYDWCVSQLAGKLDATSAAPAFSDSAAKIYAVGDHCTHNGKLYTCIVQTTGGTWNSTCWARNKLVKPPPLITPGHLAALGTGDNGTTLDDSGIPKADVAVKGNIPYDLGTQITIDSNSVQTDTTDPNNPITYAEVTLANRTANIVEIVVAIDELRVTLPAATNGKVRDFGLGIAVGDGTAALAAPALVVYGEGTESVLLMNPDGAMPELADGTATMVGATLLYFSEFGPTAFLVKGEQVQPITQ